MKIQLKGIVRTVGRVETKTSNDNKITRIQNMIVTVPGFVDGFGEKKGRDEDWQVQLMNDAIEKHELLSANLQGKKVVVDAYLNSRTYQSNGEEKFALNLNLADVQIYNG